MQEMMSSKRILRVFILFCLIYIFLTADRELFYIFFVLMFVFMFIRTLRIRTNPVAKVYILLNYLLLCIAELVFVAYNFNEESEIYFYYLNKLICTILIVLPFCIEKLLTVKKYIFFTVPSPEDLYTVSFNELKKYKSKIINSITSIKDVSKKLSAKNFIKVITDLPRHSSFKYISNGNLTDAYFEKAYSTLDNNHIYIIISRTGSPASEIISVFTNKTFNHASIAFDSNLETIVSYNGGERVYPPGLNYEIIEQFIKKEDSSILVYSLEASYEQKKRIIDKIYEINKEGSAYNLLGLVIKQSYKPNIMFCSQFVYKMLEISNLNYFKMDCQHVKPTDFIEKDYYRKAKFEYDIMAKDFKC